ncbi:hypothetical protein [Oscillatoria sp. FACHB-1406]|uniref:hypothetical protein n=1 Tax=Oscillatoria sp. FACHB-1406 TaxID=2692846 RepID=UPI00168987E2|nr:hypothetical protein [Oscillatoria sp. FACHB-1406]MBD2579278.1 hypothetical protein [Oscillatoria sp. FACHB-1406]
MSDRDFSASNNCFNANPQQIAIADRIFGGKLASIRVALASVGCRDARRTVRNLQTVNFRLRLGFRFLERMCNDF